MARSPFIAQTPFIAQRASRSGLVAVAAGLLMGCHLGRGMDRALHRKAHRAGLSTQEAHLANMDIHYLSSVGTHASAESAPRPLLVIHGFGGDALTNWAGQLSALAPERPLLLPDLLWFGRSSGQLTPSLQAQVQAMESILDLEGVDKVDIMGISYGGFVALGLLDQAPERVGRLILIDSPGPIFSPSDVQSMLHRHGLERPEDLFVPRDGDELQALLDAVMLDAPHMPRPVAKAIHAQWFAEHSDAQKRLLADLPRQRMRVDDLPIDALPAPPLVIWGAEDTIFPLSAGEELADALNGHLVVLEGAGHAPNVERRDAFNDAIIDYLNDPSPTAGRTVVPVR